MLSHHIQRLTEAHQQWQTIHSLWIQGHPIAHIAKVVGRSESALSCGITTRRQQEGAEVWPYRQQIIRKIIQGHRAPSYRGFPSHTATISHKGRTEVWNG